MLTVWTTNSPPSHNIPSPGLPTLPSLAPWEFPSSAGQRTLPLQTIPLLCSQFAIPKPPVLLLSSSPSQPPTFLDQCSLFTQTLQNIYPSSWKAPLNTHRTSTSASLGLPTWESFLPGSGPERPLPTGRRCPSPGCRRLPPQPSSPTSIGRDAAGVQGSSQSASAAPAGHAASLSAA